MDFRYFNTNCTIYCLPDDLINQIVNKLSITSFMRCSITCKWWKLFCSTILKNYICYRFGCDMDEIIDDPINQLKSIKTAKKQLFPNIKKHSSTNIKKHSTSNIIEYVKWIISNPFNNLKSLKS